MPWLSEAMKDVISCDKPRGDANNIWSWDFRMGQPNQLKTDYPSKMEANAGNWNILVPAGKGITMIPPVVASERGRAQTTPVTACVGL